MRDIFKKRATGDDFYLLDNYDSVSEFRFNKKNIFFCGISVTIFVISLPPVGQV